MLSPFASLRACSSLAMLSPFASLRACSSLAMLSPFASLRACSSLAMLSPFASLRAGSSLVILSEAKNPFHCALRVNSAKHLLFLRACNKQILRFALHHTVQGSAQDDKFECQSLGRSEER